jgi:hypothetical protein
MKAVKDRGQNRSRPAPTPRSWGGFLILPRGGRVQQVRLTGVLSEERLGELDACLVAVPTPSGAGTFVLLDATQLIHMPLGVALGLSERERRWRSRGIVAVWVGLSPYLANLLLLATAGEGLPSLPDMPTALDAVEAMAGLPPALARERLEAWDTMRH